MTRGYFVITDCSKSQMSPSSGAAHARKMRVPAFWRPFQKALRTLTRRLQIASPVTRVKTLITTMTSATP